MFPGDFSGGNGTGGLPEAQVCLRSPRLGARRRSRYPAPGRRIGAQEAGQIPGRQSHDLVPGEQGFEGVAPGCRGTSRRPVGSIGREQGHGQAGPMGQDAQGGVDGDSLASPAEAGGEQAAVGEHSHGGQGPARLHLPGGEGLAGFTQQPIWYAAKAGDLDGEAMGAQGRCDLLGDARNHWVGGGRIQPEPDLAMDLSRGEYGVGDARVPGSGPNGGGDIQALGGALHGEPADTPDQGFFLPGAQQPGPALDGRRRGLAVRAPARGRGRSLRVPGPPPGAEHEVGTDPRGQQGEQELGPAVPVTHGGVDGQPGLEQGGLALAPLGQVEAVDPVG